MYLVIVVIVVVFMCGSSSSAAAVSSLSHAPIFESIFLCFDYVVKQAQSRFYMRTNNIHKRDRIERKRKEKNSIC